MKWKVYSQDNQLYSVLWENGEEVANSLDKCSAENLVEAHNSAVLDLLGDGEDVSEEDLAYYHYQNE